MLGHYRARSTRAVPAACVRDPPPRRVCRVILRLLRIYARHGDRACWPRWRSELSIRQHHARAPGMRCARTERAPRGVAGACRSLARCRAADAGAYRVHVVCTSDNSILLIVWIEN
jgi:hypothetical protein